MTARIGIVLHHHRPEVFDLAQRAISWCTTSGVQPSLPKPDAELIGRTDAAVTDDEFGRGVDMLLSLGGDGTMLRAVQYAAPHGVPILGINAGHLGYLTEFDPGQIEEALDSWQDGSLIIEDRMLLEVSYIGSGQRPVDFALNEVVLERAQSGHTVAIDASIGGVHFTRYLADGLIVATPTGSTAYSLSAGGPIVEPNFEALLVTPVAPHMVFDRSLVLKPSTGVELTVAGYRNAAVTLDGRQVTELVPGETLVCRASNRRARFLTRGERNFHRILKDKFDLGDR